jgi:hypothetical protein
LVRRRLCSASGCTNLQQQRLLLASPIDQGVLIPTPEVGQQLSGALDVSFRIACAASPAAGRSSSGMRAVATSSNEIGYYAIALLFVCAY